jgi:pimeloyl-ACP methyl ester carboxylesterase
MAMDDHGALPSRRDLVPIAAAGAGAIAVGGGALAQAPRAEAWRVAPAQTTWTPEPPQAPAKEGMADLPGARLYYWDTGGAGEPVVLLHPATGSAAIWAYQQPALAAAGYRVIAYSRRGHYRSERGDEANPGTMAGDLRALTQFLRLGRFHLVGSAAGGFIGPDYALAFPDDVLSVTIANSLGGVQDPAYNRTTAALLPKGFTDLPPDFRELSPSYRAANPPGCKRWLELEHMAVSGAPVRQRTLGALSWANIERIAAPVLLITGDADLYQPPSRLREYASHLKNAEAVVISEAGHSAYWEQPEAFNLTLIDFLRRHRQRR